MPVFAPADINRCIPYVFKDKNLKEKAQVKNKSVYPFRKVQENPHFLQSLVEGHFYFIYFPA
jgi:hypothetical protein